MEMFWDGGGIAKVGVSTSLFSIEVCVCIHACGEFVFLSEWYLRIQSKKFCERLPPFQYAFKHPQTPNPATTTPPVSPLPLPLMALEYVYSY